MAQYSSQRTTASRLVQGLPNRSLAELRQQWLNLLRQLERWHGRTPPRHLIEFRDALLTEWNGRSQAAVHQNDYFEWPSTLANGGDGSLCGGQWYREGLLSFLGYRVGETAGMTEAARRYILDAVQSGPIPPVNGPSYMREWGQPSSSTRLQKLSNELASFTRNAKRKKASNLGVAIAEWEDDLKYLFRKYYVGKFGFGWPDTVL